MATNKVALTMDASVTVKVEEAVAGSGIASQYVELEVSVQTDRPGVMRILHTSTYGQQYSSEEYNAIVAQAGMMPYDKASIDAYNEHLEQLKAAREHALSLAEQERQEFELFQQFKKEHAEKKALEAKEAQAAAEKAAEQAELAQALATNGA